MSQVQVFTVETWLGPVYGAVSERGLCALTLPENTVRDFAEQVDRRAPEAEAQTVEPEEVEAGRQIKAYFEGRRPTLDAPLDLSGLSPFTVAVLTRVRAIPYGHTATYGRIAAEAGRPGAARAVGQVMNKNPVPLFVP